MEICWKCGKEIESYCYSVTIYFLDGSEETTEDIINDMSDKEIENYEKEIKKEYDNVDYIGIGEFCPHCLASML